NGGGLHVTGQSDLLIRNTEVTDNQAAREGGGLWNGTGTMTVENSNIQSNQAFGQAADDGGGGIFNDGGTLVLNRSNVSDNSAIVGSGSGGGLFNLNGSLVVTDSEITANQASRAGGGIEQTGNAELELRNVLLNDNRAGSAAAATPGNGGGIHISGDGNALIVGGRIEGNTAVKEGGGLWNGGGTMTIDDAAIFGNTASGDAADDGGGGIFNNGGDLVIINSSVSGNLADGTSGSGGGLLSLGGDVSVSTSTFEFNGANRAGGGIEVIEGTVTLTDSNLINNDVDGTATGGIAAPGNGGGLHVSGRADVTLTGGIVFGNLAASEGGGLWNQAGGTMIVDAARIEANSALGDDADNGGGGIFNNGGTLIIRNAEIVGNFADGASGSGGGILNVNRGTVSISDSLIAENVASRAGGGIEDASRGGELLSQGPSLTLTNVDLENNNAGVIDDGFGGGALFSSPGSGGGIHVTGASDVVISGGRIAGNIAANEGGGLWNSAIGQMSVTGTAIEDNSAVRGGGIYQQSAGASRPLRVELTNLAPDDGPTDSGLFLTPVFTAFHDGAFDLFDVGGSASPGLESLAEDGSTASLTAEFTSIQNSGLSETFGRGPIAPGQTLSRAVILDPSDNRYFSFASMVIPSNDAFIGNEDPASFPLFGADGNFNGTVDVIVAGASVWDAGTEVNSEMNAAFF
ncbi:spondin domain-containing protein, partial [Stieleria sp.]|uniref:spondin domain-containing protein n=1 Tax=Stieleria sp. TaxID=2795976 RepID=UPI003569C5E2